MKKFLVLILAIIMVLSVVACKNDPADDNSGNGGGGNATMPVEKEAAKDKLIEQGASAKSIDHTGFNIDVTVTTGGESYKLSIGGKDDVYWVGGAEGNEAMTLIFYTEKNDTGYMYMTDLGSWVNVGQSLKTVFFQTADAVLFSAYDAQQYLTKGADTSVNGRPCATYTGTIPLAQNGPSASLKMYVDKEYGVTLRIDYDDPQIAESYSLNVVPTFSNPTVPAGYAAAKAATASIV